MTRDAQNMQGFLPVRLEALASGSPLPFDLHLYFEANRHRIKWKSSGDIILPQEVPNYRRRGLSVVWILSEEFEKLRDLSGAASARTSEGSKLIPLLIDPRESSRLADESRRLLSALFQARTIDEQIDAHYRIRPLILDLLGAWHSSESRIAQSLLRVADQYPEIDHAPRVATLSLLLHFSLDSQDPADAALLALAALTHDIGRIASADRNDRSAHVDEGVRIVEATLSELIAGGSPAVIELVRAHHEFLDGSGEPRGLREGGLDLRSQLLALAELLETHASGPGDGRTRTLQDSLQELNDAESGGFLQKKFSPAIVVPLLQWTGIRPGSPESS
jgi:hypothetical protein